MTHAPSWRTFDPWLIVDLGRMRRVLSFAPHRPGLVDARHLLWRQVRDADLTPGFDACDWLVAELARIGHAGDVAMMTSRDLGHLQQARVGAVTCLATVGLGNAERVGHHRDTPHKGWGTINLALLIEDGLTDAAMIEALTIVAEARTAAILDCGLRIGSGLATGTGTDCIALACDSGPKTFAGKHTRLGRDLGRATYDAVHRGAQAWIGVHGNRLDDT